MPIRRSEGRTKAFEIWKKARGEKKLSDIAREVGAAPSSVRKWKHADRWEEQVKSAPKKRGAQKGNRNACGPHEGGPPEGNQNAVTHGAYARLMAENMTENERAVWQESDYGEDVPDALRMELRQNNVQQLRLMARLGSIRGELEGQREVINRAQKKQDREAAIASIAALRSEYYTVELALSRTSGRKARILQLLYTAGSEERAQQDIVVEFGAMPEPAMPEREEGADEDHDRLPADE